jgi:hypothetical protein
VTVDDGLLNVAHNGVVVVTHARGHLQGDDERMNRRAKVTQPARPTKGDEVFRRVDPNSGRSASPGPATGSASDTAANSFVRTKLATTKPGSSVLLLSPTASPGGPQVWHRSRSQLETRVVNSHIAGQPCLAASRIAGPHRRMEADRRGNRRDEECRLLRAPYRLPLARLWVMQSIWQFSAELPPPLLHAATWSASISPNL